MSDCQEFSVLSWAVQMETSGGVLRNPEKNLMFSRGMRGTNVTRWGHFEHHVLVT